MSTTWFISDPHFGHSNIITFKDNEGNLIRPFTSIEEHDETIIENVNKVVKSSDRLYIMGDVAMKRVHIATVAKLNGRKKLIKGNHDIYALKDYTPYFEDILACRVYPSHGLLVTHFPVHPGQLEHRFTLNVHGHLHSNVIDDTRYRNLCLEHTNFGPVSLEQLIER
jgi:calcineurin-like phosphoesterase family protein